MPARGWDSCRIYVHTLETSGAIFKKTGYITFKHFLVLCFKLKSLGMGMHYVEKLANVIVYMHCGSVGTFAEFLYIPLNFLKNLKKDRRSISLH